jgi:hypothetical protein
MTKTKPTDTISVRLFSAGRRGGINFTESDIDQMVSNAQELERRGVKLAAPLRVGHGDQPPFPTGTIARNRPSATLQSSAALGRFLLAELRNVPAFMKRLFREGRYENLSVELLRNSSAPRCVTGLAKSPRESKAPWSLVRRFSARAVLSALTSARSPMRSPRSTSRCVAPMASRSVMRGA